MFGVCVLDEVHGVWEQLFDHGSQGFSAGERRRETLLERE